MTTNSRVSYALSNNSLVTFDTSNPDNPNPAIPITGLGSGETLVGIDVRPQNGKLYGLARNNAGAVRLYVISPQTGAATALTASAVQFDNGAGSPVPITGTNFGLDFNPLVDRLRVVTDTGFNFRLNPNTGALIDGNNGLTTGTLPAGINPDGTIKGGTTRVDATAYTNNASNVTATTQYTLDANSDTLFIQNPPNSGTQTTPLKVTLGSRRLDFTAINGFDIPTGINVTTSGSPATGQGLAALNVGGKNNLYAIELSTGAATLVNSLGISQRTGTPIQGFSIQNDANTPLIGLDTANNLLRFNRTNPGATTPIAIRGLASGESVVGIDFRPATGQLFGLSTNGAGGVRLLIIDPQDGTATPLTQTFQQFDDGAGNRIPVQGTAFGVDFNPTVDLFRVVTNSGVNFRLRPTDGTIVDGNNGLTTGTLLAGVNPDGTIKGGTARVDATAYTNSFGGATTTTQYTLDATSDNLFIQSPPNSGSQIGTLPVTLNGKRLDFSAINGFDIPSGVRVSTSGAPATGQGLAALTVNNHTNLYAVELSTGAAKLLGPVGTGASNLVGLTAADAPVGGVAFGAATYSVNENGKAIGINLVRTGGTTGAFTVNLAATGGTATANSDFSGVPVNVAFADGQTTAKATINITDDVLTEGNETINLALANPSNGAVLAAQDTSTLTIVDNDVARTITGTNAGETLLGGNRNDLILGLGGNDRLLGLGGNDSLNGSTGDDILLGGSGADILLGGAGNDTLVGGTLVGGTLVSSKNSDSFVFNSNAPFKSQDLGVDQIVDFAKGVDKIGLDQTTFGPITAANIAIVNSDARAATSSGLITYSTATGNLFFNQNGAAGGLGIGNRFAQLGGKDVKLGVPVLTTADFAIVA